jgi:hypothetical protein
MRPTPLIIAALLASLSASAGFASEPLSSPAKTASQQGFGACTKLVEDLAIHSVDKSADGTPKEHGSFSSWSKTDPDKNLFSTFVVQPFSDGSAFTTIAVNRASTEGSCNAAYNRIVLYFRSCTRVREDFSEWKLKNEIGRDGIVLEKEGATNNIVMIPQGPQRDICMVVNSDPIVNYQP